MKWCFVYISCGLACFKERVVTLNLPGRRSALNEGNYVWNLVIISSIPERIVYSAFKCLIEKTCKEGNWVLQYSNIFRSNLTKNATFHLWIESDEWKLDYACQMKTKMTSFITWESWTNIKTKILFTEEFASHVVETEKYRRLRASRTGKEHHCRGLLPANWSHKI